MENEIKIQLSCFDKKSYLCSMKSKKAQSAEWVAQFSGYLFWDVDKSKLDIFKYSTYVIDRVLSHGLLSDWYLIKK